MLKMIKIKVDTTGINFVSSIYLVQAQLPLSMHNKLWGLAHYIVFYKDFDSRPRINVEGHLCTVTPTLDPSIFSPYSNYKKLYRV